MSDYVGQFHYLAQCDFPYDYSAMSPGEAVHALNEAVLDGINQIKHPVCFSRETGYYLKKKLFHRKYKKCHNFEDYNNTVLYRAASKASYNQYQLEHLRSSEVELQPNPERFWSKLRIHYHESVQPIAFQVGSVSYTDPKTACNIFAAQLSSVHRDLHLPCKSHFSPKDLKVFPFSLYAIVMLSNPEKGRNRQPLPVLTGYQQRLSKRLLTFSCHYFKHILNFFENVRISYAL